MPRKTDKALKIDPPSPRRSTSGGATTPPSLLKRSLMIGMVMFVLLAIAGPITGPQAIFGALADRGVFHDKCGFNATLARLNRSQPATCLAQEQAIEAAADLCLSICNLMCVLFGLAQDLIGARRVAFGGVVIWTIAKSLAGLYPSSGVMWTACETVAASASLGAYSSLGLVHLKEACASESAYGIWSFIGSATWDIAVLLNLGLAKWYGWTQVALWQAYLAYGLAAGLPVIGGLLLWPAPPEAAGAASPHSQEQLQSHAGFDAAAPALNSSRPGGDDVYSEADAAPSSPASPSASTRAASAVQQTAASIKGIFSTFCFWIFAAHCTVVVVVGYLMISNVGTLSRWHGSSNPQEAREITTYMMSAMGLSTAIPGRIMSAFGTRRGLVVIMTLEAILIGATGACIVIKGMVPFYIAYVLLFAWRVWGFGMTFAFISWRFAAFPAGVGVCYGGVFSLAGAISIGVGAGANHVLHSNPEATVRPLMLSLCAVALAVELLFTACIAMTKFEEPGIDDDATARALLEDQ